MTPLRLLVTLTALIVGARLPLVRVADVPLPGKATRLDYQDIDGKRGQLVIAHMGDSSVLVVSLADAAGNRARAARDRVETDLSFERRTRIVENIYAELMESRELGRHLGEGSRTWAFEKSQNR